MYACRKKLRKLQYYINFNFLPEIWYTIYEICFLNEYSKK